MNKSWVAISIACVLIFSQSALCQWTKSALPEGNRDVICIATNGNTIFAGSNMGVFVSTDTGATWSWTDSTHLPFGNVMALMLKDNKLFAGVGSSLHGTPGVYVSTDSGRVWTATNNSILKNTDVWALASIGENLFAGAADSGVFLSTNGGASWTAVNSGLSGEGVHVFTVIGTTLYAGTGNGVYLSPNNGASWLSANNGIIGEDIWGIAVSGNYLLVGTLTDGMFRYSLNGAFWAQDNTGLPYPRVDWVHALAVSGTTVFAATQGGGVFESTNNGASWTAINTGLTDLFIYSLAVNDNYLYAGGGNYDVWRRPLSEITAASSPRQNAAQIKPCLHISTLASLRASVFLTYSIQSPCFVQLDIFSMSGRRIAVIDKGEKTTGSYSVMVEKGIVGDGVYVCRFRAGNYEESHLLGGIK